MDFAITEWPSIVPDEAYADPVFIHSNGLLITVAGINPSRRVEPATAQVLVYTGQW